jgi:sulfur carrier protein
MYMALSLILNGQQREFAALTSGTALSGLIAELQLKGDRIAVELNGELVERARWPEVLLSAGDRLEVVHFVGGGTGE